MKPRKARIYMMGDSITEGDGNGSAYRYALFEKLCRAGAVFEFLGVNTSGDIRLPEKYRRHGGHCGYVIGSDETTEGSLRRKMSEKDYREAAARADIILLWIGFNDMNRQIDPEHIGERFNNLLDEIYSVNPDVTIYAATLFDKPHYADFSQYLLNYDEAGSRARGRRIHIVDMNQPEFKLIDGGPQSDFPEDDGHPQESGNRKIAEMWMRAIGDEVLAINRRGDPDYEPPVRVNAIAADLCDTVLRPGEGHTFRASVVPENAEITTILWRSSAPDVAVVDDYGTVCARKNGSTLISAATLDGGFRSVARLNVSGAPFDIGEGMETVLEEHFMSPDDWSGEKSVIKPEYAKLSWQWNTPESGELTRNAPIPLGSRMLVSFDYATANDRTRSRDRSLLVSLGGVDIRISGGGMYTELYEDGKQLGCVQTLPKVAVRENYTLMRDGHAVTLYKNNEKLLTAKAALPPKEGTLRFEWHGFDHKNFVWSFVVRRG